MLTNHPQDDASLDWRAAYIEGVGLGLGLDRTRAPSNHLFPPYILTLTTKYFKYKKGQCQKPNEEGSEATQSIICMGVTSWRTHTDSAYALTSVARRVPRS